MARGSAIVVIGVGARTPVGLSVAASAAAVRAGVSVVQDHPSMIDRFGQPMRVTRDVALDLGRPGADRAVELALAPALEALASLSNVRQPKAVALFLATGEERPGQAANHAAEVYAGLESGLAGELTVHSGGVMAGGHAGGILGLLHARDVLTQGEASLCLVGGVDSYLVPETLEWLDENEQLHSEGNLYGFCPGEAAGFCLLSTLGTANELSCRPLAELVAVAAAREKNCIKSETVCVGEGLGTAFRHVMDQATAEPMRIDRIVCDLNGERFRANEYGFAVLRSPRRFRNAADFETPADCWGDVGAASGPLFVGLVTEAHARGYAKGPLSLIWASSERGGRAAALLRKPYETLQ